MPAQLFLPKKLGNTGLLLYVYISVPYLDVVGGGSVDLDPSF